MKPGPYNPNILFTNAFGTKFALTYLFSTWGTMPTRHPLVFSLCTRAHACDAIQVYNSEWKVTGSTTSSTKQYQNARASPIPPGHDDLISPAQSCTSISAVTNTAWN